MPVTRKWKLQWWSGLTCCTFGKKVTTTFIYKKYKPSFYLQNLWWLCERERETERDRTARINTISSDLHQVAIYPENPLLLHGSFTGQACQLGCCCPKQCNVSTLLTALPNWLLGLKTSIIIYFSDAHTFPCMSHLHNSSHAIHVAFPLSSRRSCTSRFWNPHKLAYQRSVCNKRTVNQIFWGRDTCSHSKVEHCYWEKWWLCWEVGMWCTEDQLHFDVWFMFLCQ